MRHIQRNRSERTKTRSKPKKKIDNVISETLVENQQYPIEVIVSKKNKESVVKEVERLEKKQSVAKIKADDIFNIEPLTENQKKFFDAYDRGDYFIMLYGSAGSGKSFISMYKALVELFDKTSPYRRIIIIRSAVVGRDVGFLPGSLDDKMSLFEQPYVQICHSIFNRRDAYDVLKDSGKIEFMSTSYLRGLTFDDAIIIADECQNLNWAEASTIFSRIGNRSKIIFTGDYRQNDLYRKSSDKSGLKKFHEVAKLMPSFTGIEFTTQDIVRSSICKEFIIATERYEDQHKEFVD